MSLRLLALVTQGVESAEIEELLDDVPTTLIWSSVGEGSTGMVHVLLDAQHVEAASDALLERFGSDGDARMVVLPVEATVPRLEEPEENGEAEDSSDDSSAADEPIRISREELYQDLSEASSLTPVYMVMVVLSTVVAVIGLIRGDVAIVIGAMIIAPLLGAHVALSLASTLGDPGLAWRALKTIGVGAAIAGALSFLLGAVLTFDPDAPELVARTRADFGDIAVALAAGTAGSLAFTSGVPAAVVGVMIAVAILPPLVTTGLLAGSGHQMAALGALMLLLTNVTCINLAAVGTFLLLKVRPRTWWEAERAGKATRLAAATWIAMLVVLVALMGLRRWLSL